MNDDTPLRDLHRAWQNPPGELVGKLPRAGVQLDYLGHAAVTRALLETDPYWTWKPVALTEHGTPYIGHQGNRLVMWIRLEVCGVSRLGVGTCPDNKGDPEKELIGDALRNAAMRFGVALSLWAKEEWADEVVGVGEAGFSVDSQDVQAELAPTQDAGPGEADNDGARSVGTATPGTVLSQPDTMTRSQLRGQVRAGRVMLDTENRKRLVAWMKDTSRWPVDSLTIEQLQDTLAYINAMTPEG